MVKEIKWVLTIFILLVLYMFSACGHKDSGISVGDSTVYISGTLLESDLSESSNFMNNKLISKNTTEGNGVLGIYYIAVIPSTDREGTHYYKINEDGTFKFPIETKGDYIFKLLDEYGLPEKELDFGEEDRAVILIDTSINLGDIYLGGTGPNIVVKNTQAVSKEESSLIPEVVNHSLKSIIENILENTGKGKLEKNGEIERILLNVKTNDSNTIKEFIELKLDNEIGEYGELNFTSDIAIKISLEHNNGSKEEKTIYTKFNYLFNGNDEYIKNPGEEIIKIVVLIKQMRNGESQSSKDFDQIVEEIENNSTFEDAIINNIDEENYDNIINDSQDTADKEIKGDLLGIEIFNNPLKLNYIKGEELDLTNLIIKATYSKNPNVKNIISNEELSVSGFDKNTLGEQTIIITYKDKSVTFKVNVSMESKVISIRPLNNSINIAKSSNIVITVSGEKLDEKVKGTVSLYGTNYIDGVNSSISISNNTIVINPYNDFLNSKEYSNIVISGFKDISGKIIVTYSNSTYKFKTIDDNVSTGPTVSSVDSSTSNGTYKIGDTISINVNFSESVTVTGIPQLTLETGSTDRTASYLSGSGSSTLVFTYTVQSGDANSDLDYESTTALSLNSGTIKDSLGNSATLTLASPGATNSLGSNKALVIDGVKPEISSVTTPSDGSTGVSVSSNLVIQFSESLNTSVTGWSISLGTGSLNLTSSNASISYSTTTNSNDTITIDPNSDLSNETTYGSITITGFEDSNGNEMDSYDNSSYDFITEDTTGPTVSSVSSTTINGTYKIGDSIILTVTFNESVTVTGIPQLTLETGSTDRTASYLSGSGSSTLVFTYTVEIGDTSSDLDYTSTTALSLNSGTIKDSLGNSATLTLASPGATNSLGSNKALVIDGVKPSGYSISIDQSIITSSNEGNLSFTFIGAEVGSTYNYSIDDTNAGTNAITGSGTITSAVQQISNLDVNSLDDDTLTLTVYLTDSNGNQGSNTTDTVTKDSTVPTVSSVTTPSDGSTSVSVSSNLVIKFSKSLNTSVTGWSVSLGIGSLNLNSSNASISYSTTTNSNDTVTIDPNSDLNSETTYGNIMVSGFEDSNGNEMNSYDNSSYDFITEDTTGPTVSSVDSSTSNGTYKIGDTISINVNFSESVTVTGIPQLTLETGSTDRTASYLSGSGSSTLVFTYTVQSGDANSDLDYESTTALSLNSGTIKDSLGNSATLTLASPGATNSLGSNKALVIDGVKPEISSVTTPSDGSTGVSVSSNLVIQFSESLNTSVTGWSISLGTGSLNLTSSNASISYSTTTNTNDTITINPTSDLSESTSYGDITISGLKDSVGNIMSSYNDSSYDFTTVSGSSIPTDYKVYLKFDGNTTDETGTYTITEGGSGTSPTLTQDRHGDSNKAYDFGGSSYKYFKINSFTKSTTTSTWMFWMRYVNVSGASPGILGYGDSNRTPSIEIYGGKLSYNIGNSGYYEANYEPIADTWIHVAITKTGDIVKVYVNGVLQSTSGSDSLSTNESTSGSLYIGADHNEDKWAGGLDEIMIYDRVLTEAEIQDIYNDQK